MALAVSLRVVARTCPFVRIRLSRKKSVNRIERGETGLGASLEQYERGMALINHCREILQAAEKRIEKIASSDETPEKKDSNTANVDKDDSDDSDNSDNKDDSLF